MTFDRRSVTIDPNDTERLEGDLCRLLGVTGSAGRARRERVERAVLALLRHVLPRPQQSMKNDLTVARCVASELERGEWLRFVTTGNLPGKPNGSAVVYVTRTVVGVAQLTENLDSRPVIRLPLVDLEVERTDGRRLWRRVTDLELASGARAVRVEGIFGEEADEFLDALGDGRWNTEWDTFELVSLAHAAAGPGVGSQAPVPDGGHGRQIWSAWWTKAWRAAAKPRRSSKMSNRISASSSAR